MNETREATRKSINYMFVRSKITSVKHESSVIKININKLICSSLKNITKYPKIDKINE